MTDELELLRNWDADTAPLTEPARAKARHRLLNTMAHAERHPDTSPAAATRSDSRQPQWSLWRLRERRC